MLIEMLSSREANCLAKFPSTSMHAYIHFLHGGKGSDEHIIKKWCVKKCGGGRVPVYIGVLRVCFLSGMAPRNGTDKDAGDLQKCFRKIGFKVSVYNDLSCDDMEQQLTKGNHELPLL